MSVLSLWVHTACTWEVTARKLGDVNPLHDLATLRFADFSRAAAAFAPVFESAPHRRIGETVLEAVRVMRSTVGVNTHLGTILLLAPLAAVALAEDLGTGLAGRLDSLDLTDARLVYEAIRLAQPSGLGRAPEQDVAEEPTLPLRDVMALAAARDLVARQYAHGFQDIFGLGVPALMWGLRATASVEGGILVCQVAWLAEHPDSLIARKLGSQEAREISRAAQALQDGDQWPCDPARWKHWRKLDCWMRAQPGRNPGTTADLVAACLFVALRSGILTVPPTLPWTCSLAP
jgi:triphosphoribosyl-dephospho-CoA synthase